MLYWRHVHAYPFALAKPHCAAAGAPLAHRFCRAGKAPLPQLAGRAPAKQTARRPGQRKGLIAADVPSCLE